MYTTKEANEITAKAYEAIDNMLLKFNVKSDNGDIDKKVIPIPKNKFTVLPTDLADGGVEMCSMDSNRNFSDAIVYFPPNATVKIHTHTGIVEYLNIVSGGELMYKIYNDAAGTKLEAQGTLRRLVPLTIGEGKGHIVFSTHASVWVLIRFDFSN